MGQTGEHIQPKRDSKAALAALAVFIGGASYGLVAPIIKLANEAGFVWAQIMPAQSFGGLFLFAIAFGVSLLMGKKWQKTSKSDWIRLLALGATTGLTNLSYNFCLTSTSASLGVTLLFQYVWMGIAIQCVMSRKPPIAMEVLAAIIVLGGTVAASGVLDGSLQLNVPGLLTGLGAALGYSIFLLISAHAGKETPMFQRGFITCLGSCAVGLIVCPTYLIGGVDLLGIAPYSLLMGLFALFLPVPLIGFGAKHISGGACNILASSELPSAFVASAIVLGEVIAPVRVVGMIVILVGIALTQVKLKKAPLKADQ